MMRASSVIAMMVVLVVALSGCTWMIEGVRGSRTVVRETREVSGFSEIRIEMGADATLVQGDGESLVIEADDNLMQHIETRVEGDRLIVSSTLRWRMAPSRPVHLTIGFDTLSAIEVRGNSDITGANLDLDELTLSFAGNGSTDLQGRVDRQIIRVAGNAKIHNFDLISRAAEVDILGNGEVEVTAKETLSIQVSGNGKVTYAGDPQLTQRVLGSATIERR